jgi:hypothetical protein
VGKVGVGQVPKNLVAGLLSKVSAGLSPRSFPSPPTFFSFERKAVFLLGGNYVFYFWGLFKVSVY